MLSGTLGCGGKLNLQESWHRLIALRVHSWVMFPCADLASAALSNVPPPSSSQLMANLRAFGRGRAGTNVRGQYGAAVRFYVAVCDTMVDI